MIKKTKQYTTYICDCGNGRELIKWRIRNHVKDPNTNEWVPVYGWSMLTGNRQYLEVKFCYNCGTRLPLDVADGLYIAERV